MTHQVTSNGWVVTDPFPSGLRHVVPIDDLYGHVSDDCWCGATEHERDPDLIVHNSGDERERFDRGERNPS